MLSFYYNSHLNYKDWTFTAYIVDKAFIEHRCVKWKIILLLIFISVLVFVSFPFVKEVLPPCMHIPTHTSR